MELRNKLLFSIFLIVMVITAGTVGYVILEGWGLFDALYMTVITITTIGYEEVHELSEAGRVFTVVLILISVGAVFYALNYAARAIIEGEIKNIFGRRKLQKTIDRLSGHFIICGYGRMGRIICDELKRSGKSFIVIEKEPETDPVKAPDALILKGDATNDEVLISAGIERASGLISVLPTDAENLYVVLSARVIAPKLSIVARAVTEGSEKKLMRAGANRVVSPYHIGALRIARMLLKPTVADFIELTTQRGNIDLWMDEIVVNEGSALAGSTLDQCTIGRELGALIVAVKGLDGKIEVNPKLSYTLSAGDTLVAIGETSKLKALEEQAGSA